MKNKQLVIFDNYFDNEEYQNFDWDDFESGLAQLLENNCALLKGTLGLWYGKVEGGKFIKTVNDFTKTLSECDYIRIYDQNGHLYIEASHHDGTNFYELKLLTNNGMDFASQNHFAHNKKLHTTIFNNNFYSKLPRFYSKFCA